MSDFNSSLPVRTESAGDLAVKIVDASITSQQLAVNSDGSINAVVSATNLDIRDLSHSQDSIKVGDGTDFLAVNTDGSLNITDNGGSITVDGSVTVSATNLDIRDLAAATDSVASWVKDGSGNSISSTSGALDVHVANSSIAVTGPLTNTELRASDVNVNLTNASVVVTATALDIRALTPATDSVKISDGTDSLAINADGSLNVVVTSSVAGDPICDYKDDSAIAAGSSSNHDYTVTAGKSLKLTGVLAAASGKCKVEVKVETAVGSGTFNTKFVAFNSTANPNMQIFPTGDIVVAAGVRVRVTKTNKDLSAQDLYSTIEGSEF
jgi:hypothetical protein